MGSNDNTAGVTKQEITNKDQTKQNIAKSLFIIIALITIVLFLSIDRIAQDEGYHTFADTQSYGSINTTFNVLSNIPFFIVGIIGVYQLTRRPKNTFTLAENIFPAYLLLFFSIALVGIGSGYYHLNPNSETLVWDRLPMTIFFMALYCIIISEFVSIRLGKTLLLPFLLLGISSVLYWWYSESNGVGDLRFYAVIQFFPLLTIPIILRCYHSRYISSTRYWLLILSYFLAKLCEHFDQQIYDIFVIISGHSIKHILPAIGLYYILQAYLQEKNE